MFNMFYLLVYILKSHLKYSMKKLGKTDLNIFFELSHCKKLIIFSAHEKDGQRIHAIIVEHR